MKKLLIIFGILFFLCSYSATKDVVFGQHRDFSAQWKKIAATKEAGRLFCEPNSNGFRFDDKQFSGWLPMFKEMSNDIQHSFYNRLFVHLSDINQNNAVGVAVI